MKERKRIGEKAQLKRESLFQKIRQGRSGQLGWRRRRRPVEGEQVGSMDWVGWAESQKRNQMKIEFQISNEFGFLSRL
jgi:hypothetical protein